MAEERATHSEAPASWTVRYTTEDGYGCMLTLRGDSGAELLPKTLAAVQWLTAHGCQPDGPKRSEGAPAKANDTLLCPLHGVPMPRRDRNGQSWYSHRLDDGTWCRGKA